MLLLEIYRNQRLAAKRSPLYERNRFAKFLISFGILFWMAYLIYFGTALYFILQEEMPNMEPYHVLNSTLVLFLILDFFLRFLLRTPVQEVKPYLLLPVSRKRVLDAFLLQAAFSKFNLVWLFLFIPFAWLSVRPFYGWTGITSYAVGIWLLMVFNGYCSMLIRTLVHQRFVYILLAILLYGLMLLISFLPLDEPNGGFFMNLGEGYIEGNPWAFTGTTAAAACMAGVNRLMQARLIYRELARTEDNRIKRVSDYSFLERYGLIGEYMRLELKLIFRNKTPRKNFQMMCIVLVLFAAILFGITQESTQSVYSIQLYSIYCFTGFAVSILTRIMAYEGNYLDGLMVRRESLLSLFRAKYYFHCLLLVFPLVLLLPSIIWSGLPAGLVVSQLFLTAGIILPLIMQLAWINRKTAPLDASIMGKGQWNSPYQMVIVFFAFFFPILFSNLLFLVLSENMAYLVCTLLGMAGIAAQPLWMRYLYRQVIRKRYDILTNLRDTR